MKINLKTYLQILSPRKNIFLCIFQQWFLTRVFVPIRDLSHRLKSLRKVFCLRVQTMRTCFLSLSAVCIPSLVYGVPQHNSRNWMVSGTGFLADASSHLCSISKKGPFASQEHSTDSSSQDPKSLKGFDIKNMTLEEQVGQLLMVHFLGESVNEDAKALIQDLKVGGIIYYNWANGLHAPEQVCALSEGLQSLAQANRNSIPLFIAVDQEGGVVSRLHQGFTSFPGNKALGMAKDLGLAEDVAFAIGKELRSVGVNMNLAPVVDVNVNVRNPVIGIRSFGEDPQWVSMLGQRTLMGSKRAHMIGVLKHFPGHGDTWVDSHLDLPVVQKSMEELKQVELLPFARLASEAEAIMTAHILVPAFDEENCATLSKKTLAFLRDALHFQGVIITDSLVMQGVLRKCQTVEEAAICALDAGCDVLCLGGRLLLGTGGQKELTVADIQSIHSAVVQAVKTGRISESRLHDAVQHVLALKERSLDLDVREIDVPWKMHQELAHRVAALALQAVHREPLLDLRGKKMVIIAPELLRSTLLQTPLSGLGTEIFFFQGLNPSDAERESARRLVEGADGVFIFSYNAWKNVSQRELVQELLDTGKSHILLVVRDPLDASLFPSAKHVFTTFSPTVSAIQVVGEKIQECFH